MKLFSRDILVPWGVAVGFALIWTVLAVGFYPVIMEDTVNRYGMMAEAFASGNWREAFHPRFGIIFQVLSGMLVWLTGLDGVRACQATSIMILAIGCVPLYRLLMMIFDDWRIALLGMCIFLGHTDILGYAMDGLRDPLRSVGVLCYVIGLLSLIRGGRGLMAALGCLLLCLVRGDCYLISIVGVLGFVGTDIFMHKWKIVRSVPVVALALVATLLLCWMNYVYLGCFVPAVRYIDVFRRLMAAITGGGQ